MFALGSFPLSISRALRFGGKFVWRPATHWLRARGSVTSAAPSIGRGTTRSVLGTTAGTALFVFSGSILAWPIADLCLGPQLVWWGMKAEPSQTGNLLASTVVEDVFQKTTSAKDASVVVVSGVPGAGKQLEHLAAHSERLVVYISLREATSSHDLYFAILAGIYSADRLGLVGTLAHSMGVWWITLFDIMVGYEPEKTRAINFSLILQHLRRALRLAHAEQPLSAPRPLVILDHIGDSTHHEDDRRMRSMLTHLLKWCTATCYDDALSDIVICDDAQHYSGKWFGSGGRAQYLQNTGAFKSCSRTRWSL